MHYSILLFFFLLFLITGCSSRETADTTKPGNQPLNRLTLNSPVPPNHAGISATVVSINQELDQANPDTPCGKVPCSATLRIDKIFGYGSSMKPISPGTNILTWFNYTTGSVDDSTFPGLSAPLPGIAVGDSILAMVKYSDSRAAFIINDYTLLK